MHDPTPPPPSSFLPERRLPPVPALFAGGLALVAAVTWAVLALRPDADPLSTAGAYELPDVPGVTRRSARRVAPAPRTARPDPASTAPPDSPTAPPPPPGEPVAVVPADRDGPAVPIFAPRAPGAPPTPAAPEIPEPRPPTVPSPSLPDPTPTPAAAAPSGLDPSLPTIPPVPEDGEPGPATFAGAATPSGPSGPDAPTAATTPERKPPVPADWRVLLIGDGAESAASAASKLAEDRRLVTPKGRVVRFSPRAGEPSEARTGVRFVVERRPGTLTLTEVRLPEPLDDPIAALVPPAGLVPDVLVGVPLEVPAASEGAALGALSLLLSGDGATAAGLLEPKPTATGPRVLLAYALLLKGELPKVHDLVFGLGDDPALGHVARFLTGAALLTDRNPREAIRDFQAALRQKPTFWPARLLEAESNARLELPEAAAKGFEEVLAVVPDRAEAVMAQAYYVAAKDRPAAVAAVTRLVKARPDLAPAWWMLGWVRRQGDTSEDARAEVAAFETVTFLRPKDPEAWRELGTAQLRWADTAGGIEARRAAAAAFAEQVALAPRDGLGWFNRGSVLHQLATAVPLAGDTAELARRLAEVRTCYRKALEAGTLSPSDAARVHHNVGLVIDLLPSGADGAKAGAAFQASADADPSYAQGALALVAARVAERDGAGAAKALARVPADADATEKGVLTAAVRWISGDAVGAAAALRETGESPTAAGDLALRVLGGLVATGYRRAALTLLEAQPVDAPRLGLRVRARAALRDVEGLRKDLVTLSRLDRKLAERLRERDPEVLATLGPAATAGAPEDRLR